MSDETEIQTDPVTARLEAAAAVARSAGQTALAMFNDRDALRIDHKGVQDRVTNADRQAENAIREHLGKLFPDDGFIGEEFGAASPSEAADSGTWVIDPIDGTDCFIFEMPSWCVSIAWIDKGETVIGVIYDPVHDELFSAVRGRGATLNGAPIRASDATDSRLGLIGIGHSLRVDPILTLAALGRLMDMGGMFHRCGSGALSLAWVAAGRLIGYYEPHMNAWDCLAGLLLVREAGGWSNDFLQGGALKAGNLAAAAAPGMVNQIKFISGLSSNFDAGDRPAETP